MKFYLTKKAQLEAQGRAVAGSRDMRKQQEKRRSPDLVAEVAAETITQSKGLSTTAARRNNVDPADVASAKKRPNGVIAIGGLPRVDLLPPEVRLERHAAVNVRRAWTGVVGLAVLVGVASATAALYNQSANNTLLAAQNQTAVLSGQSAKYSSVKTIQGKVDMIDAARKVGGSTDIDWPSYLAKVQATLPTGMTLSTVSITSASPVVAYAQSTTPLQGQRIGTLTFAATSAELPAVPTWLTNLGSLPGFADASAGTVSLSSGVYTSNVVVHINEKALSNAYAKKGK